MTRKDYLYPDVNDKITAALVTEKEPYRGYWAKSEKCVLDLMRKYVHDNVQKTTDTWLFDAGCGEGRLLLEFERYFDHILATDPDSSRIEIAENFARKYGFKEKVVFQSVSIEKLDWRKESINVILCSHVLQHVHSDSVPQILEESKKLLKREGLLFITTCHSRSNEDYYVKGYLKNSELIEERIGKEEFNSLIFNERDILPLHFFSMKNVIEMLKNLGFTILVLRSFHVLGRMSILDKIIDRDHVVNSIDFLKSRLGRDMAVIARKIR